MATRSRPAKQRTENVVKSRIWTDDEKLLLAKALKQHGLEDLESTAKLFPNRSVDEVKDYVEERLQNAKALAKKSTKTNPDLLLIDKWLDITKEAENKDNVNLDMCLIMAWKFKALFEDCSSNSKNDSLLSQYVAKLCAGDPPADLPSELSAEVLSAFDYSDNVVKCRDLKAEKNALDLVSKAPGVFIRKYSAKVKKSGQEMTEDNILKIPQECMEFKYLE